MINPPFSSTGFVHPPKTPEFFSRRAIPDRRPIEWARRYYGDERDQIDQNFISLAEAIAYGEWVGMPHGTRVNATELQSANQTLHDQGIALRPWTIVLVNGAVPGAEETCFVALFAEAADAVRFRLTAD